MGDSKHKTFKRLAGTAFACAVIGIMAIRLTAESPSSADKPYVLPVRTTDVQLENGYYARRSFTGKAVARRDSNIAFELGGTVQEVFVDLGSKVRKGEQIACLDTSRLEAKKAELIAEKEAVIASLQLAEQTLARAKKTYSQGHISAQHMDEAEANAINLKAQFKRLEAAIGVLDVGLAKSTVLAPYDGVVTSRFLDEGTVVMAGAPVITLSEQGKLEAHIGLPPEQAVALGSGAAITLYNGQKHLIEGAELIAVVPIIEGHTRTMMATFSLPEGEAKSGELITAASQTWHETQGAWLPLRALSSDVRGLWRVYKVIEGQDGLHVRFENVQIIYTEDNRVFVTGTISSGDRIIADGIDRLAPGQHVRLQPLPEKSG